MRLSELKSGQRGIIVKVYGHGGFRKRIVEMGFVKGKMVEVLLDAPLRDPIKYKIMGYEISLRRREAQMIEVISLEEAREQAKESCDCACDKLAPLAGTEERCCDKLKKVALGKRREINVALVGNPNCGKTSLFNIASGLHEHVGNYSGVTVDAKEGYFDFEGYRFRMVDLPGTYSLSAYSPEEKYVRKHLIEETPDVVINVVDASNLERNLYLTTQLIDMDMRMVIALNMYDELEKSGNTLDHVMLGKLFGVPVIPTVCKKGVGIDTLLHVIINIYEGADYLDEKGNVDQDTAKALLEWHKQHVDTEKHTTHIADYTHTHDTPERVLRHIHVNHGPKLEECVELVRTPILKNDEIRHKYSTRFLAIKLLENDAEVESLLFDLPNKDEIIKARNLAVRKIAQSLNEDSESAITDAKYAFISGALRQTFIDNQLDDRKTTKLIDSIVTHRLWGFPIFLLFMYIMFMGTFVLGEYPMMAIEWGVEQLGEFIKAQMSDGILKDMLVDGIINGVGGVIVFLPNILILYFFISLMEDSGYMARAAFIMDKVMHKMGLHGKSFIPLIMGFGCNVPAIMATRTIENRKNRLVTILVNPLMSCSARLPIYLLLIGTFFPNNPGFMLFLIYIIGITLAVVLAKLFSKFLVKGEDVPFVMELPPYRMPTMKAIGRHTWEKGAQYLKKMGGVILIASILVWFLGAFPKGDYATSTEQQENSYIGRIGKVIEPVIEPLGFDWKMGVGLLAGSGAKELVVSTLGVLYANDAEATNLSLGERLPMTPLVAFGYMLFVLIYFPCVATIVVIKQEAGGWKWALFTVLYTTTLAWTMAFLVYQIGSLFV